MPTQNDLHVDGLLSNVSVGYVQAAGAFVSGLVFPDISVAKQSDLYATFDRAEFFRDEMQKRADSSESAGGGFKVGQDNYFAHVYALHKDIGDQQRANADSVYQLDKSTTIYLTQQSMISKEKIWASEYFTGGSWTTDWDGVAGVPSSNEFRQWSDYTNSDPVADVTAAATAVQLLTGYRPNKMVMGREVFDKLKNHPDILERIGAGGSGTGPATMTTSSASKAQVAALFELDEVLVMDAIENTAKEGAPINNQFIGGKKALLYYVPSAPGLWTPSAGYTFSWSGLLGQAGMGTRVSKFRMENLRADRIEIEQAFAMKQVAADLGAFFDTAVA